MAIVGEEQVVKVLRQYNPWWQKASEIKEKSKTQKRVAFHEALRMMTHDTLRRFVVLSGARQVGKTTILYQVMEKLMDEGVRPQNILYVSFDNPPFQPIRFLRIFDVETIFNIYESIQPVEGTKYIFLDEIQYSRDWEIWLKVLYDKREDIRLIATESANLELEHGAADSGTGRWNVLKIPTLSFYEYCRLLGLQEVRLPEKARVAELAGMEHGALGELMERFKGRGLEGYFNRYLMIGGFPELALANDDQSTQKMLRENIVDKVLRRNVFSKDAFVLFRLENSWLMEKLFLYLCRNSSEIFNAKMAVREIRNSTKWDITVTMLESYIKFLEMSNLIYLARPMDVGSKGALKGRPKIFIADTAIRNAVLMVEDVLSDEKEFGVTVETAVYKHMASFYQGKGGVVGYFRKAKDTQKEVDVVVEMPREKILCEVKYRNNSKLTKGDAIVELCEDEGSKVTRAFLITKRLEDFGETRHETRVPIMRVPAMVFLYLVGKEEAEKGNF